MKDKVAPGSRQGSKMRTVLAKVFALKSMGIVLFNLFGACVFLLVSSLFWVDPRIADVPGASGADPILWAQIAFPIAKIFVPFNLLFILWACGVYVWKRKWIVGWAYLLVPVIWPIAFWIIYLHRWPN